MSPFRRFAALQLALLLLAGCWPRTGWAHGAFDHSVQVKVLPDRLDVSLSIGRAGAQLFLDSDLANRLVAAPTNTLQALPLPVAGQLFQIQSGTTLLAPRKAHVYREGEDITFDLTYPPPAPGSLRIEALYLRGATDLKSGLLFVCDQSEDMLGAKTVSPADPVLELTLTQAVLNAPVPRPNANANTSAAVFLPFLKLGVRHILGGIDHLLFLGALLLGVRKARPMLAIVTCFTIAHSVTLALAALGLVTLSPRIVEPIIAASIIVVGIDNLTRRDAVSDRYWLAGAFGLIHGFGFAGALQDAGLGQGGASITLPLFSFNLGVETGQLAVAAVVLPLLLALRRWPAFERLGPRVLSIGIIAVSTWWLYQRLLP